MKYFNKFYKIHLIINIKKSSNIKELYKRWAKLLDLNFINYYNLKIPNYKFKKMQLASLNL